MRYESASLKLVYILIEFYTWLNFFVKKSGVSYIQAYLFKFNSYLFVFLLDECFDFSTTKHVDIKHPNNWIYFRIHIIFVWGRFNFGTSVCAALWSEYSLLWTLNRYTFTHSTTSCLILNSVLNPNRVVIVIAYISSTFVQHDLLVSSSILLSSGCLPRYCCLLAVFFVLAVFFDLAVSILPSHKMYIMYEVLYTVVHLSDRLTSSLQENGGHIFPRTDG